jgi:hypothetical protein
MFSFQAGFSVVLGIHFWGFLKFLLYVIFVDLIAVGIVIASGTVPWISCPATIYPSSTFYRYFWLSQ